MPHPKRKKIAVVAKAGATGKSAQRADGWLVEPGNVFHDNHVSYSRITTFKQCPRRFECVYLRGWEDLPGRAAQVGSVVHKMLELYAEDVAAGHRNHAEADLDALCGYLPAALAACDAAGDAAGEVRARDVRGYLRQFKALNPSLRDVACVEKRNECVINGYSFVSIIDRVDAHGAETLLIDYKTGNPKYARNRQLNLYAYAMHAGKYAPVRLEYQFLKTGEKREWRYTEKKHAGVEEWVFSHVEKIEGTTHFKPVRSPLCDYCTFQGQCGE